MSTVDGLKALSTTFQPRPALLVKLAQALQTFDSASPLSLETQGKIRLMLAVRC